MQLSTHPHCRTIKRFIGTDGSYYYVLKTNLKTWVVSTQAPMSLDSMVEVAGEYHFCTLRDLKAAAISAGIAEVTR